MEWGERQRVSEGDTFRDGERQSWRERVERERKIQRERERRGQRQAVLLREHGVHTSWDFIPGDLFSVLNRTGPGLVPQATLVEVNFTN